MARPRCHLHPREPGQQRCEACHRQRQKEYQARQPTTGPRKGHFSPSEDLLVLKAISWSEARDLAERLGRTTQTIINRRKLLRTRRGTLSAPEVPKIGPHLDRPDWFEEDLDLQAQRGQSIQKRKDLQKKRD